MREPMLVAVSLDVEEEGLFCGRYQCDRVTTDNVRHLVRLAPLLERGVKPTLFCAYSVFAAADSRRVLEGFRDRAEIGVHLHHWNTPPIAQNIPASGELRSVPACQVPLQFMESKLAHLLEAAVDFLGETPTSFRMGRWDLHASFLASLRAKGILCDASVRPLHSHTDKNSGPDHFGAPAEPYWLKCPAGSLLEAPLSVTPLLAPFAHIPAASAFGRRLRASLRHWGALALLPIQHPLWLLKFTTNLLANSGIRYLSLTWHSSEMMPGATPHLPDRASVDSFLAKIGRYLDWLEQSFNISYVTMSELRNLGNWRAIQARVGDWTLAEGGADGR